LVDEGLRVTVYEELKTEKEKEKEKEKSKYNVEIITEQRIPC
jgi:hypothetical protein